MPGMLEGKVALVTGASSGIGRGAALAFAGEGAKVVVAARRTGEGEGTVREIEALGGEALFVKTDVSKGAEIEAPVRRTVEAYGRLDCALNNAGVLEVAPAAELAPAPPHTPSRLPGSPWRPAAEEARETNTKQEERSTRTKEDEACARSRSPGSAGQRCWRYARFPCPIRVRARSPSTSPTRG